MNRFLIIFCIAFGLAKAQHKTMDSLWDIYHSSYQTDTSRLNALHLIINSIQRSEPDSAFKLALQEIHEAQQKKLLKQEAKGYTILGLLQTDKGDYAQSMINQEKALAIMTDLNNKKGIGNCFNNIANNYMLQSNYTMALKYHLKALKQREEIKDSSGICTSYTNMGIVYSELKEYNLSILYFIKTLKIKQQLHDKNIATLYSNIAASFGNKQMNQVALYYEKKSLELSTKTNNKKQKAINYSNISASYQALNQLDSALKYQTKAIEIRELINDKYGLATSYGNLANIYASLNIFDKAIIYGEKSIELSKKIGASELEIDVHENLSKIYSKIKEYEKSLYHHRLFTQTKDSIFNIEKTKELSELKTNFEVEKVQQKSNELAQQKQQKLIITSLIIILLILLTSTLLYVRYKKQTFEQKTNQALLEQKLLRLQMNPHFIFNCLGSIQSYVATNKPIEANRYLANLSIVMRRVLEDSKFEYITLQQEMTFLDNYLKLQSLVLDDELHYNIHSEENINIETISIPTMLIQPFVENAIIHGISKNKGRHGFISITFSQINNTILCTIEDNGIGISNSEQKNNKQHTSMAIQIVKERLAFLQKKSINDIKISINDIFDVQNNSIGTKVDLYLPFIAA